MAIKIFELGMARFGGEAEYVGEYLDFLIQLNDDQNTRALFERAVQSLESESALSIWTQYLGFEARFGDRATLRELERRMRGAYPTKPETTNTSFFYNRHSFGSLHPKNIVTGTKEAEEGPPGGGQRELFVVPEDIMNLLYVLPKAERWDGPAVDAMEVMSRLSGTTAKPSLKHSLGRRREEGEPVDGKAAFPLKRSRK